MTPSSRDSPSRTFVRVGKDRVQRPSYECGHLNVIRKINYDRCDAPKQAARKRPRRRRETLTKRTSTVMHNKLVLSLRHLFRRRGPAQYAPGTPHPHAHAPPPPPSYMPQIPHELSTLPTQSMAPALPDPQASARRQMPEFGRIGLESIPLPIMPGVHTTHSFVQTQ